MKTDFAISDVVARAIGCSPVADATGATVWFCADGGVSPAFAVATIACVEAFADAVASCMARATLNVATAVTSFGFTNALTAILRMCSGYALEDATTDGEIDADGATG